MPGTRVAIIRHDSKITFGIVGATVGAQGRGVGVGYQGVAGARRPTWCDLLVAGMAC